MDASARLNGLASGEALPQVTEKVGLLLDVAFAKKRGNSPSGLLGVVEGNASNTRQLGSARRVGVTKTWWWLGIGQTYGNMW